MLSVACPPHGPARNAETAKLPYRSRPHCRHGQLGVTKMTTIRVAWAGDAVCHEIGRSKRLPAAWSLAWR